MITKSKYLVGRGSVKLVTLDNRGRVGPKKRLFTYYASQCQGQHRDKQAQAGTKQGQTGTSRDKQGHSLSVPACPCLSQSVHAFPCLSLCVSVCLCLSLSILVCPCLSLYVSTFAKPLCLPLQMNITVFISMNIVTLTFLAKATVLIHANLVFNFFFTFHLASSITLLFNPNSSIPVKNISKGST